MSSFWQPFLDRVRRGSTIVFLPACSITPQWLKDQVSLSVRPVQVFVSQEGVLVTDRQQPEPYAQAVKHDVDIVICEELVLTHEVTLPRVARREVTRAVMMDAERVMPVRTQGLLLTHLAHETKVGLEIQLVAVHQTLIEQVMLQARNQGLRVRAVMARLGETCVEFPVDVLKRRYYGRVAAVTAAMLMFFWLLGKIPDAYIARLSGEVERTDAAIAVAQADTAQIAGLQQQIETLQGLTGAVRQASDKNKVLYMLAALTTAASDQVVIDELRLDGDGLFLIGRAATPEDWVIQLQKDRHFEKVRLTSVLAARDGIRRFEIHMQVVWTGRGEGA